MVWYNYQKHRKGDWHMVEVPSFSVICELLEGKPGGWERVKPMVKLALLVSPVLAGECFVLKEILGEGLTWTDSADILENSINRIWDVFSKKKTTPTDLLWKLRMANTLLLYSAYFDTLERKNPPLWEIVKLTGEESHVLTNSTLERENLMARDGCTILPGIGDDKLLSFYTELNSEFRRFTDGLQGTAGLWKDESKYPAMASEHYRDQYDALRARFQKFAVWSDGKSEAFIHNMLEQILDAVKQQKNSMERLAPPPLNLPLGEVMPHHRFLGRDGLLKEMAERMERDRRIVLSGLGGIGKTELAKFYAHCDQQKRGCRVYFATFDESFENTVIRCIAKGVPNLPENLTEQQTYDFIIHRLCQCGQDDLLIIDNADWEEGCYGDPKDQAYKDLIDLDMRLMVTTRFWDPDFLNVPRLDNEALYQIFRVHKVRIKQEQMDALIRAVDGHTMTIDMMAILYRRKGGTVTPEQLVAAMEKSTLDEEDDWIVRTKHNPKQQKIYAHLRALFNLTGLSEAAQMLLRYAVLIPQDGLASVLFFDTMGEGMGEEIADLVDRGWLRLEDGMYSMHPVIRLVCCRELKPTVEQCSDFLGALWDRYGRMEYDKVRYRQLAELFSNASANLEDKEKIWAYCAGNVWYDLGDYRKALKYWEETLKLWKSAHPRALEQHKEVLEIRVLRESVDRYSMSGEGKEVYLAELYNSMGLVCVYLEKYEEAEAYLKKSLAEKKRYLDENDPSIATGYTNLGLAYDGLKKYDCALRYHRKAMKIREEKLGKNHLLTAECYSNIGAVFFHSGEYPKAKKYLKEALKLKESMPQKDDLSIATSHNNLGADYMFLGELQKASLHMKEALHIRVEILGSCHPLTASSYYNYGVVNRKLNRPELALKYLVAALRIYRLTLGNEHSETQKTVKHLSEQLMESYPNEDLEEWIARQPHTMPI